MKKFFNVQRTSLLKLCSNKITRFMKLTTLLLLFTALNVFGTRSYSQYAKLNLDMKDVPIQSVLSNIEQQSEFFFLYSSKMIDVNQRVDIKAEGEGINQVLEDLFTDSGIRYTIKDRQILLVSKEAEESLALQQKIISGTVTDKDGSPVPGVNVRVTGTTQGVITDFNGKYSIDVPQGTNSLIFSFIGMQPQEIIIGTQTQINVTMEEILTGLNEVVVVGYGTQKKVNLTGAVDVVNAKQIGVRAVTNVSEALQGISPNLNITPTGLSSEPGGKMNLNIRGVGSLTGDYSPYVLVDGVPMDLNSINTNDIESLTILKDAARSEERRVG